MSWSAIKKRYEAFLCDAFRKRVNIHITSYRRDAERGDGNLAAASLGRGWIELDGKELLSLSGKDAAAIVTDPAGPSPQRIDSALWSASSVGRQGLYEAVEGYPQLSIEQALHSESFVVRGLAMLDRRLGKRRLAQLDTAQEHPFVQLLWRLRHEGE